MSLRQEEITLEYVKNRTKRLIFNIVNESMGDKELLCESMKEAISIMIYHRKNFEDSHNDVSDEYENHEPNNPCEINEEDDRSLKDRILDVMIFNKRSGGMTLNQIRRQIITYTQKEIVEDLNRMRNKQVIINNRNTPCTWHLMNDANIKRHIMIRLQGKDRLNVNQIRARSRFGKKELNRALYQMRENGVLFKDLATPPLWSIMQ